MQYHDPTGDDNYHDPTGDNNYQKPHPVGYKYWCSHVRQCTTHKKFCMAIKFQFYRVIKLEGTTSMIVALLRFGRIGWTGQLELDELDELDELATQLENVKECDFQVSATNADWFQ